MSRSSFLHRFGRDQRGVSAIEFSFIAPIMIVMFFGIAELGQGLFAQRRNEHVAAAIGDLTAQDGTVTNADMANIFDAGEQVMAPLPISTLTMRVTCVTTNSSSVPKVTWSDAQGVAANTVGATYTMPTGLVTAPNQVFIVSEATYRYTSPIGYVLPQGMSFSNKSYLSPRLSTVTRTS